MKTIVAVLTILGIIGFFAKPKKKSLAEYRKHYKEFGHLQGIRPE